MNEDPTLGTVRETLQCAVGVEGAFWANKPYKERYFTLKRETILFSVVYPGDN